MSVTDVVTLSNEQLEALADLIADRLHDDARPAPTRGLLSPQELATALGIARSWVYRHQTKLGVRRLGAGPRARLRFDRDQAIAAIAALTAGPELTGDAKPRRAQPRARRTGAGSVLAVRGSKPVIE